MQGWIKLHRRVLKHWIFQDSEYFKFWIYILLDVNHEDKKILWNKELVEIKRGEKITSLKKLSEEFNCSREKVRRFLELLKNDTMIDIVSNTRYTQITVLNYDSYQADEHTGNTRKKHERDTSETRTDINKNDKNIKNYKNILLSELKNSDFENPLYFEITLSFYELFKHNLTERNVSTSRLEKAKGAWVNNIRLLFEQDKYTIDDLRDVYEFLKVDNFWKQNILSTSKLREKFDKLLLKARINGEHKTSISKKGCTPEELAEVVSKHFAVDSQG